MGEVGCLKDGIFQNLQVGGTGMLFQKSDIVNTSGVLLNTRLPKTSILDFTSRTEFLDEFSRTLGTKTVTGHTDTTGKYSTGTTTYVATVTDGSAGSTQTIVKGGAGNSVFPSGGNRCTAFVTDDRDDDSIQLQSIGDPFSVTDDTEFYMETRFKVDDKVTTDLIIGLASIHAATIDGVDDGIYFIVADGVATVTAVVEKNTNTTAATLHTLVNDTFVTLGLYKSAGNGTVKLYLNGVATAATLAMTNLPDDVEIVPTIAFQNGSAAASTLTMDYLYILNR